MVKRNKKLIAILVVGLFIGVFLTGGVEKFQKYQHKRELEKRIATLKYEIDSGNYESAESEDYTRYLSLSNFTAKNDGTYVKAFGAIKNISGTHIDEIGSIAFFDSIGSIIRVKAMHVKLPAGETLYFEELIGLTRDGTQVPTSAELSDF